MSRSRRLVVAVAAAPAVALAAVLAFAPGSHSEPAVPPSQLPPPSQPAFAVPRPKPLRTQRGVSEFAVIGRAVTARVSPRPGARPIARVSLRTPEGTANVLQLLGKARLESGELWQQVRLAVLPNGTTGWVPRSALGSPVLRDTRLVVDRRRFRATLFRDGVRVFSAPIGVGEAQSTTPAGDFYVRDVLTRYRSPTYGPIAFGTSARSATLTDWPAGGYIGIHGTDQPGLIPGAISHGCIRMRNADILRLAKLMPVGTPVIIR